MSQDGRRLLITDPDTVAERHADPWRHTWGCGESEEAAREINLIRSRRAHKADEARSYARNLDFSPKAIRGGCSTFRSDTAIGVDGVTFTSVRALPDAALIALCSMMRRAVANLVLPLGTLLNRLNPLGKKGGGNRTIATMSSFYRLLARVCGDDISDWDLERAGHWDSAVAGSSALRAHILRSMEVELATAGGDSESQFLWDGNVL